VDQLGAVIGGKCRNIRVAQAAPGQSAQARRRASPPTGGTSSQADQQDFKYRAAGVEALHNSKRPWASAHWGREVCHFKSQSRDRSDPARDRGHAAGPAVDVTGGRVIVQPEGLSAQPRRTLNGSRTYARSFTPTPCAVLHLADPVNLTCIEPRIRNFLPDRTLTLLRAHIARVRARRRDRIDLRSWGMCANHLPVAYPRIEFMRDEGPVAQALLCDVCEQNQALAHKAGRRHAPPAELRHRLGPKMSGRA